MSQGFKTITLIADDLTGALDSAAAFVPIFGSLFLGGTKGSGNTVVDTMTREASVKDVLSRISPALKKLNPKPNVLNFWKVDSLLRGHAGIEVIAAVKEGVFNNLIIAPAFPSQKRMTRGGHQHVWDGKQFSPTGENILETFRQNGLELQIGNPEKVSPGFNLLNAETDRDLDQIVMKGIQLSGSTLWVGSAGLSSALARSMGARRLPRERLELPFLGLVGSNHSVMQSQLKHVKRFHRVLVSPKNPTVETLSQAMAKTSILFLSCDIALGTARTLASALIQERFKIAPCLPMPKTLFVSGGETLRDLLNPLDVKSIEVLSIFEDGVPISRLNGGYWDGVKVVSKSGAFGSERFLENLVEILGSTSFGTEQ